MKRALGALLTAASIASPAAALSSPALLGRAFFADWQKGDRNAMYSRLNPEFQDHWAKPDFDAFFAERPLKLMNEREWKGDGFLHYSAEVLLPRFVYAWSLIFDEEGRVAGLRLTSDEAKTAYPSSHEKHPRVVGFPFGTDAWTVSGEHHKVARSQRYALDLRVVKAGAAWAGDERDNRSYFAYAKTVVSPVDGMVVSVRDEEDDNIPSQTRASEGNSITIKAGDDFYVYLTHLRRGSLLVSAGQPVKRGQPVAQVGNSGHSTEPHLHLEAFDSLPRETADAWPLAFESVELNGRRKAQAAPSYGDVVEAAQ